MFKELGLSRTFLVYALIVPMALLLGYVLASPTDFQSLAIISLVIMVIALPIFLKWHHAMLVFCWNAAFIVFFLPGQPSLWTVMACGSLLIAILHRSLRKQDVFIHAPSVTRPLFLLVFVVLATLIYTGGAGSRALGSDLWGARRYVGVFGAIIGFFALTSQSVPRARTNLYVALFFLSGTTNLISDLAYAAGPSFYFLFSLFSPEVAGTQASSSMTSLQRYSGVAWASLFAFFFLMMRYGIRGVLDLTKPWRLVLVFMTIILSMMGGYRSTMIIMFSIFVMQFYYEGLFRSRYLPILLVVGTLAGVFMVAFISRMPLVVQRSLSFLPLDVDPLAKQDALGTLDWRLQMWKVVIPEVPRYFFLGKGYNYSGTDYYLTEEANRRGFFTAYDPTLVSGNYHNGFLTIIIPFGIFGLLAFLWFCWAAGRVLIRNFRYGPPELKGTNTFLLAYFMGRLLFYFVFYGQFDLDLYMFTGVVGLNISLNGGVHSQATEPVSDEATLPSALAPASA